jgi:hypothetical protein
VAYCRVSTDMQAEEGQSLDPRVSAASTGQDENHDHRDDGQGQLHRALRE